MGSSPHVYVGPYLRCVNGKVNTVQKDEGCPACLIRIIGAQFCSRCGTATRKDVEFSVQKDRVNAFDVSDRIKERLHWWDGYDSNDDAVWMPNIKLGGVNRDLSPDNGVVVPITSEMMANELLAFRKFFEDEFRVMDQEYGAANVRVEFGVVYYYW